MTDFIFLSISFVIIVSALCVVLTPRLIHAAVYLFFTLFGVAGLYIFLYADFLAATQVLVYVGGILVLIIFGVMLTNRVSNSTLLISSINQFISAILCLSFFLLNLLVIYSTDWRVNQNLEQLEDGTTATIGKMLLVDYLLPFELVSILLLGVLIGSAMLSRDSK
tara:strand:- start:112 stop:606 length:495 start_codon:yes stop_codon:yes gene_type:complete